MTNDELKVYESFARKGGTASSATMLEFIDAVRSARAEVEELRVLRHKDYVARALESNLAVANGDAIAHRLRCEQLEERVAVLERESLTDVGRIREQRELMDCATRFRIGDCYISATSPGQPWSIMIPGRVLNFPSYGLERDEAIARAAVKPT